jgi:hypothetical protein
MDACKTLDAGGENVFMDAMGCVSYNVRIL